MHLYILTRGIQHDTTRFINDLQAQYFPFRYKGEKVMVQIGVRPIQLYELVFPAPELAAVLKTISPNDVSRYGNPLQKKMTNVLRVALNAKKIPDLNLNNVSPHIIYKHNVHIEGIGIKKDSYNDDGECL